MKFAAIDIGSNAIRLQISRVFVGKDKQPIFKKLEYVRFPLRLGQDVFSKRRITEATEAKFLKLMTAFKTLIELYEVDNYFACATSAMREAENGDQITKRTLEETGLDIHIIDGKMEAELINKVISHNLSDGLTIHIDVGGGSTELNIYKNKKKTAAKSFKIGSVRNMSYKNNDNWMIIKEWINKKINGEGLPVIAIGTGGNIKKLHELSLTKDGKPLSIKKLQKTRKYLSTFTYEERLSQLMLNPDRADVIIPASEIYYSVMKWAGAKSIYVPEIGLKDGLIEMMYEKAVVKN